MKYPKIVVEISAAINVIATGQNVCTKKITVQPSVLCFVYGTDQKSILVLVFVHPRIAESYLIKRNVLGSTTFLVYVSKCF